MYQQQQPQQVYMQQQPQVYMQQQPQAYYAPQPQVIQMQPMMQPQQQMYVQPQVMVQPVMQPVIQIAQPLPMGAGAALLSNNPMPQQTPGAPQYGQIDKLLNSLKEATTFTVRYMEPNFRAGEGGYKFAIYGRDKQNPFAHGYSTSSGDASIEVVDHHEPYPIVQVKNTSATIFNLQSGQKDMFGTVALSKGTCGSFQVAAEKGGNRTIIFQNRQFSLLFCCCCSLLYLLHFQCCSNRNKFTVVNGEGEEQGNAEYRTDDLKSFRELDINLTRGDLHNNAFVILESLLYMHQKVKNTLKGNMADNSFDY